MINKPNVSRKSKQPLLLLVYPYVFTSQKTYKYELDSFSESHSIVVLQLSHFFCPKLSDLSSEEIHGYSVSSPRTYLDLISFLFGLQLSCDSLVFHTCDYSNTPRAFIVQLILKAIYLLKSPRVVIFSNPGTVPSIPTRNPLHYPLTPARILYLLRSCFSLFTYSVSRPYRPSCVLVAGSHYLPQNKPFSRQQQSVLLAHSPDISQCISFLQSRPTLQPAIPSKKYLLLLDGQSPYSNFDYLLLHNSVPSLPHWLSELHTFLELFSEYHSLDVLIAAHYRVDQSMYDRLFPHYPVLHGRTIESVYNSSVVLTRNSSAAAIALFFNKPLVYLTSNELESSFPTVCSETRYRSRLTSSSLINISAPSTYDFLPPNPLKYREHLSSYFTSCIDSNYTNSQLLSNFFHRQIPH